MNKKFSAELEKNSPIPLYFQIKEDIIQKIKQKQYHVEDRLPSETELMDLYDVSRTTIRKAVDALVNEGYLEVRRGIGTFIQQPKKNLWDLAELRSFNEEVGRQGLKGTTKMLSIDKVNSNEKLEEVFNGYYKEFYQLDRLRYIEGDPSVLVTTFVPMDITPELDRFNFSEDSLFRIFKEEYQLKIDYAVKTFSAINVEEEDARLLKIEKGCAIQLVETITYDDEGYPIEFSISRDRGDITRFKVILKNKNLN